MAAAVERPPVRLCVPSELDPPLNTTVVEDRNGLDRVAAFLGRVNVFGLDCETNMTDKFFDRRIRTIQLGDRHEQYVIDLLAFAGSTHNLIEGLGGYYRDRTVPHLCDAVVEVLRPALESKAWLKVGSHIQFDYECLKWCLGLRTWNVFDTELAEKVLFAGEVGFFESGFWGVADMVERYLGLHISKDEQTKFDLEAPLTPSQITYCGLDARLPIAIMGVQKRRLNAEGLERAAQIEFDALPAFGDMHLNGMGMDADKWLGLVEYNKTRKDAIVAKLDEVFVPLVGRKELPPSQEELDALEKIWKTAEGDERKKAREVFMTRRKARTAFNHRMKKGDDAFEGEAAINYGAPAQVRDALRCIRGAGFNKNTLPDTNDQTLKKLSKLPPKIDPDAAFVGELPYPPFDKLGPIDLLRIYRAFDKRLDTYGPDWLQAIDKDTRRVHSRFNQLGAETGRPTSQQPNLYNLPRDKRYRSCFVAPDGKVVLTQDCSGQELRILTEYSQEPIWIDTFRKGWDLHSVCADLLLGDRWRVAAEATCTFIEKKVKCSCKVHKKFREWLKSVNFGLAYGMTAKRLSLELGISYEDAEGLLHAFYNAFPTVIAYLARSGEDAKYTMQARTLSGRRRKFKKPTWQAAHNALLKDLKRLPTGKEISKKLAAMYAVIEREGKNTPIQGSGADWMKRAMGCGFDEHGQPYMWHRLESEFGGKLINFVYDEFVTEADRDNAEPQYAFVGDCIVRAGQEFIKTIPVEWEGSGTNETKWTK